MRRRRFLTIAGAALLSRPGLSSPVRWDGVAMGADVSVTLDGPPAAARAALDEVRAVVRRMERAFSLYDPASELSVLNRDGGLDTPSCDMRTLLALCGAVHAATGGRFDPTVQPVWRALATGGDAAAAREAVGWDRVTVGDRISLGDGQALTLNGIAQGYATDAVREVLKAQGFQRVLVNIGEYAALGAGWRVGIADAGAGIVEVARLSDRAIATSSPDAMTVGGGGHVLDPAGRAAPRWSTVSVEADSATWADGLSTGLCLCDLASARGVIGRAPGVSALFVDGAGQAFRVR